MNVRTLLADLKDCSNARDLARGKQIHEEAVKCGCDSNKYVATTLISMYAKCGSMVDASQVFHSMKHPNVVSWTALILGYAENGHALSALELFTRMKTEGPAPNSVTCLAALKACTSLAMEGGAKGWAECRKRGKEVHHHAMENGCYSDGFFQNTLIDMYARCRSMVDARQVFDGMQRPDVVSWNVLILGYAENGQSFTALSFFTRMRSRGIASNTVTFLAVLKACSSLATEGGRAECRDRGKKIHNLGIENSWDSDMHVQSALMDMYAKCGSMVEACQVFSAMKQADAVSWNAIILGYAENGQGFLSLELFIKMRNEGPAPNSVTFLAVLKACGLVGGLEFGRAVHSEIGGDLDVVLVTSLVDFYAKCGSLEEAESVFDAHTDSRDVVTWTALLAGFSSCGDHESAFRLFRGMQDAGLAPDSVTFLCILTCCSHAGFVEKGRAFFDAMSTKYGILPSIEHYNCLVDVLGRANKFDDAMALLDRIPCSPDDVTWTIALGACRKWKNLEVGRLAFQSLISFKDDDAFGYLLMGQIYESRGMFRELEVMRLRLKFRACEKRGESIWTNEAGEVHTFLSSDRRIDPSEVERQMEWKTERMNVPCFSM